MQALQTGVASGVGSRMLSEIEDASLDQILTSLRANLIAARQHINKEEDTDSYKTGIADEESYHARHVSTPLKTFPIAQLDLLVQRQFRATETAPLAVTGRYHELLYLLVAALIAQPHEKAVAIVDFEGRFDPFQILSTGPHQGAKHGARRADLDHVHIMRPFRGDAAYMAKCVASVEDYMLYGDHPSRTREWWGTIVIGGGHNPAGNTSAAASAQVAVTAGRRGWLRVDRAMSDSKAEFPTGSSLEEALDSREKRQRLFEEAGWVATCPWGQFTFGGNSMT